MKPAVERRRRCRNGRKQKETEETEN